VVGGRRCRPRRRAGARRRLLNLSPRDLRHTVRRASRGDAGVRRVARWTAGARLSPCASEADQRTSEESYGWRRRAGSVSPDWP
jgi:hypothetical protein